MAHVRRKFEEIHDKKHDRRTAYILKLFQLLWDVERDCKEKNYSLEKIVEVRKEKADPVLDEIEAWLQKEKFNSDNDKAMREAVAYANNRWDKLRLYTSNGIMALDNNAVERIIRVVSIGRKNYMFSGSHEGAQRSAMLYSLTESCKLNGLNPMVWLTDVLTRMSYLPPEPEILRMLLPNNWKPADTAASILEPVSASQ